MIIVGKRDSRLNDYFIASGSAITAVRALCEKLADGIMKCISSAVGFV